MREAVETTENSITLVVKKGAFLLLSVFILPREYCTSLCEKRQSCAESASHQRIISYNAQAK